MYSRDMVTVEFLALWRKTGTRDFIMKTMLFGADMLAILAILTTGAVDAGAENDPGPAGSAIASGKCKQLVVGGQDLTAQCKEQVGSVTLPDGAIMFIFSYGHKMVAFQGDGRTVQGVAEGKARLPVQFINMGRLIDQSEEVRDVEVVRASGSCEFSDPYRGLPASVNCSATSAFGMTSARFLTDGSLPQHHSVDQE